MVDYMFFLSMLAMTLVAVILALGLYNMIKRGSPNTSQKLMRWRILVQFIAIIIMMSALYLAGSSK